MLFISLASGVLFGSACASDRVPPARFADTQAAISAADAVGAQHEPRAALHLKLAKDQLAQARAQNQDGNEDEAALALARASVDAEAALMVTREAAARRDAQKSAQEVQKLSN
jgi:hypothetical protein